jgi:hypothetical protein
MGENKLRYVIGNIWLIAVSAGLLAGAWRFADWRNWRHYYPTILFVICIDFTISILTYEYPTWYFHPSVLSPNHTTADFLVAFTNLPPMVLLFLSRYPSLGPLSRQIAYMAAWGAAWTLVEGTFALTGMMSYHNGWNFGWSILFWQLMFPVVRLHDLRPLLAWLAILGFAVGGLLYFHIPLAHLK